MVDAFCRKCSEKGIDQVDIVVPVEQKSLLDYMLLIHNHRVRQDQ